MVKYLQNIHRSVLMAVTIIPTDEFLHSQLEYGKADFPFSCYTDRFPYYKNYSTKWHWHDELEFSYVQEGQICCSIGSNRISVCSGDGIL